jgi:hypothetical protein
LTRRPASRFRAGSSRSFPVSRTARTETGHMAYNAGHTPGSRNLPPPGPRRVRILQIANLFKDGGIQTTNGISPGWQPEPHQSKAEAKAHSRPTRATTSVETSHNNLFNEKCVQDNRLLCPRQQRKASARREDVRPLCWQIGARTQILQRIRTRWQT